MSGFFSAFKQFGHLGELGDVDSSAPPPVDNWILATGSWDDTGIWIDADVWID